MLMMLAVWQGWEKIRAADAHDAARLAGSGKKQGQLMLMMLAVWRGWGKILGQLVGEKIRTADAHDWPFGEVWGKVSAADAHDAGRLARFREK